MKKDLLIMTTAVVLFAVAAAGMLSGCKRDPSDRLADVPPCPAGTHLTQYIVREHGTAGGWQAVCDVDKPDAGPR